MQDDLDLALAFMDLLPPDPVFLNTLLKICIDRGDKNMLTSALQVWLSAPGLFHTSNLALKMEITLRKDASVRLLDYMYLNTDETLQLAIILA